MLLLAGIPFDFDEETQGLPWIHSLHKGRLSLDYVSTTLAHEASYKLDLSFTSDRAIALTMLERVYHSQIRRAALERGEEEDDDAPSDGADILNAKLNGEPVDFKHWRIGKQKGEHFVVDDSVQTTNARNRWRLPLTGQ